MRTASGYEGETIVDPENVLAKELKRRGLLDLAISDRKGYPQGMVQPGVLVGGGKIGILYSWAIKPGVVGSVLLSQDHWLILPFNADEPRRGQRPTSTQ